MGRKIYDEDLRLNLILNGQGLASGSAKMVAELGKMEHEMIALENKAKKLALSIKNLEKNAVANASKLATERAEYAQLTQTIRAHALALEQQRQKVGLLGMTVQQLRNHIKELQIKLFNMSGSQGTPLFQALQRELRETQIRLNTLVTGASRLSQAWSRMEQTINKAGTVVGWFAMAVFGVVRLVGNVITRMKELEDLMGVVRKNTELTVGQVWEMKEAFDQWDTRTKTDDLLKLAIVAGKLGIQGKDDILKFTEAANMIQVALGDDLDGTVEDTVNSIGKLTNAYRVLTKENKKTGKDFTLDEAMMATGSVLNELAKSSAASAGTILNYMTRLSAVGELAGFTIAQIGGIGSTLDAMNVPAERGATAMQRIMLALANPKKIQEFADALGLTAEGYVDMLKKDPNQAMTRLLHKFVTTKNGLVELTGGLKDFGAKGMYMTAVVGTMAQNLDVLAQQQEVAATAWDKQQSVLDEYNIMNNNFTANVLKQQKVIRAQTDHMNREAEPAVLRLVTIWASFVVGIRNSTDWIAKHWTAIKTMTFAYLLLKTPAIWRISNLVLESVWTKANLLLMRARIVWMQAEILWTRNLTGAQIVLMNQSKFLTIAHIALTQGIGPAIAAIRALAVSMYALPGVAAVATIAALAGAFYMLVLRKNDLTEAEKRHMDLQKEVRDGFFTEKANLEVMMDRLKDANISQEERLMLIKKINSEYGEYLPRLIDEGASAEDLAKSYDLVVEALARKITYEKTSKAGADIKIEMDRTREKIKLAKEEMEAYKLTKAAQMAMMNPEANVPAMYAMDQMGAKIKKLEKSYADYASEYTRLQSEFTAVAPRKQTIEIDNKIVDFPTEESFKDSQEALKRNFEQTELLIKQHALKTKATDEQLNENLRSAKIKYLRAQLQDMVDKYRTEGEFEDNYRSAQVALTDELLAQQKEGRKEGDKDEKKDAKGRIKDVKEFGEELINVEKLRISAIADEREKAVAEENLRHQQEIGKYWQNDEAIEYEETAHLQNMADINLKYLDKQLADKAVDFAQKKNLLEQYRANERISEVQYQTTKAALEKQEAEAMVEYKKQAGLYSADQLAALEITELKKSE